MLEMIFIIFILLTLSQLMLNRKTFFRDLAVCGSLGVIGNAWSDIAKLMQTEVSEYMQNGLPGGIVDIGETDIISRVNTYGSDIPFGVFVTKGAVENSAVLPDATGEVTGVVGLGVTVRTLSITGGAGYADEAVMSIIKRGRVWVEVENSVTAESAAFVRFVAGAGEQLGAFRSNADGTDAVALPYAKFVTDADAGEMAILELNMV